MILTIRRLSLIVTQKKLAVQLSLQINSGEMWGILGPNGSGKTTLLHTLAGLRKEKEGEILLDEQSLNQLSRIDIAKQIGILFQETPASFSQSVWDYCIEARFPHLNYFKKLTFDDKKLAEKILNQFELTHLKNKKITELSGGEKRRLDIAALLIQTPHIYLLDEPINHLDIRYQIKVLRHFQSMTQVERSIVILSLHDINFAQQFCTHILLLFHDGSYRYGKKNDLLTAENLSALYQYPIKPFLFPNQTIWAFC